ncbi:MAG: transcriptional regulator [Nitrosotalea sp.]
MSGLDTLIAKSLEITLKEKLGVQTFQKIQTRIFEKHGMKFKEAIEDFQKLDSVLKEFFGSRAEDIEKQIVDEIIILEKSKRQERKWITIENITLVKLILESIGDEDKKNILNTVLDESRIISDILEMNNIPQTSGYRKVNGLILNGMLIPQGFLMTHDGKKVTKYKSVFENISIDMVKNKVFVRILPSEESIAKSAILQLVHS